MSDLPKGWVEVPIGDVCKVVGGSTPSTTVPGYWGGDIAWLTPDDLARNQSQLVSSGRRFLTKAGYESCSTQMVPEGTVLFTSRAPIGYVAIASRPLCTNQGFKSFVPPDGLSSQYLYWYLRWATPIIREMGSGTTFAEISGRVARTIPLRIPPTTEQERIVAAIEEQFSRLDAGLAALRSAQTRLQHLSRSIVLALIEGQGTKVRLGDVSDIRLGRQRSPKNHTGTNMVPYLRAANVTWDGLDLTDVKEMNFTPAEAAVYRLERGDVLVAEASGSATEVGKPAIWDESIEGCCFQNTLLRLRSDELFPEYTHLVLLALARSGEFARASRGVGIHHLGKAGLSAIMIPLPSLDIQRELVATISHRLAQCAQLDKAIESELRRAMRLRTSILSAAFSGTLTSQETTDEPAAVLLERIARGSLADGQRRRASQERAQQKVSR